MAKIAAKLDGLIEHPLVKGNPELHQFIINHFQDALPKTYKGAARIRSPNNFVYAKASDKPRPTDLLGNPLPKVRTHVQVCISELQQIKDENKIRKAAGKPTMDADEKKTMLRKLLKDPQFKTMYEQKYIAKYNADRELYRQAQLRNPMAQNKAYVLDDKTLEYRQRTADDDDIECDVEGSGDEA